MLANKLTAGTIHMLGNGYDPLRKSGRTTANILEALAAAMRGGNCKILIDLHKGEPDTIQMASHIRERAQSIVDLLGLHYITIFTELNRVYVVNNLFGIARQGWVVE